MHFRHNASRAGARSPALVALVAAMLASAAASGCSSGVDAATAAAEGRTMAPVAVRAPGPLRLVGDAFVEVPLDPEQRRAIALMGEEASARHAVVARAMRGAATALAVEIERGKIERAEMRPHIDAIADAFAASQPKDRAAVERLHVLLDIEQRQLLADAIEERIGDARDDTSLHDKWAAWRAELALTEDQREAIAHDVIERIGWSFHWGHPKPGRDVLEAFVEEGFVFDEVARPIDVHSAVAARAARVFDVVEAALPHLTPQQRKLAAARITRRGDADLP